MVLAILILATIADLALAALMIGVSGFIFGHGPESGHAGVLVGTLYALFLLSCVLAPAIGFFLRARGKLGPGILVALIPLLVAFVAANLPPPY